MNSIVLFCILPNKAIFFYNFSSNFRFSVWSVWMVVSCVQTGAIQTVRRSSDTFERARFCQRMTWQLASGRDKWCVWMVTLRVLKSHLFLSNRHSSTFTQFFLEFLAFCAFSHVFAWVLIIFCHFVLYLSFLGILLYLLHSFQFFFNC